MGRPFGSCSSLRTDKGTEHGTRAPTRATEMASTICSPRRAPIALVAALLFATVAGSLEMDGSQVVAKLKSACDEETSLSQKLIEAGYDLFLKAFVERTKIRDVILESRRQFKEQLEGSTGANAKRKIRTDHKARLCGMLESLSEVLNASGLL